MSNSGNAVLGRFVSWVSITWRLSAVMLVMERVMVLGKAWGATKREKNVARNSQCVFMGFCPLFASVRLSLQIDQQNPHGIEYYVSSRLERQ